MTDNTTSETLRDKIKQSIKKTGYHIELTAVEGSNMDFEESRREYYERVSDEILELFEAEIQERVKEAVVKERQNIRAIFDTFEWDPTGTSFDEHAGRRTPGDINWAKAKNSDFAWSAMQAQSRIDKYIAELTKEEGKV